jgi:peptide/nickel transport system permease protein
MRILARLLRLAATLAVVFLCSGFFGAVLVRISPGFDTDEREIDPRLGAEAIEAIREQRAAERDIVAYYTAYSRRMLSGDLGESRILQRPVRELLADRAPVTARLAGAGLAAGWVAGLTAAMAAGLFRIPGTGALAGTLSSLATSIPVALSAFAVLYWSLPVWLCVAGAIFPRVYRYTVAGLAGQWSQTAVAAARARGIPEARVLAHYVAAPVLLRTAALAGVTVSIAVGAAVPVEVLADEPGIGQLMWKAASGRDLPVLTSLTMLVTAVTLTANAAADLAVEWLDGNAA